jgi:Icc-related predicted phosphoesterase
MRIWIFSDLHLEFGWMDFEFEIPKADLCLVAGDILNDGPTKAIQVLAEHITDMPVVFVCGNHDFYRTFLTESLGPAALEAAKHPNIFLLENGLIEIGEFVVAGATLWTDFRLMGHQELAMSHCERWMADYAVIRWTKNPYAPLRPINTLRKHSESTRFLSSFLQTHGDRRTIVVTHHAPSKRSIAPQHADDITSAAFASALDSLILDRGPELWVHGHVHHRLDYLIGGTRVVCNPRGYYGESNFADFDRSFVIEI